MTDEHFTFPYSNPEAVADYFPLDGLNPEIDRVIDICVLLPEGENDWAIERQHGNTTVVFEGIALDNPKHVLVDAYDDVQKANDYANIGGSRKPILPKNADALFSINGRPILNFSDEPLHDRLPQLAELAESLNNIMEKTDDAMHPSIMVGTPLAASSFAAMYSTGQPAVSAAYFDIATGESHRFTDALFLHEKSHWAHEDGQSEAHARYGKWMEEDIGIDHFLELHDKAPKLFPYVLLSACQGDTETVEKNLQVIGERLDELAVAVAPLIDHIKSYPAIESLSGREIAEDMDGDDTLRQHIMAAPAIEFPAAWDDTSTTLNRLTERIDASSMGALCEKLDAEGINYLSSAHFVERTGTVGFTQQDMERILPAYDRMIQSHSGLLADLSQLEAIGKQLMHAKEFRADAYAVEHADDPHAVAEWVEQWLSPLLGDPNKEHSTHPSVNDRIAAAKELAAAKEKPVVGEGKWTGRPNMPQENIRGV